MSYLPPCASCLRVKPSTVKDRGQVGSLLIPPYANSLVYLDFTHMGSYGKYDYVLTMVDSLTKFVRTVPCNTHITGKESVELFLDRWVAPFSEPLHLHSDNDPRFTPEKGWWQNVLKSIGIQPS